eukprot:TRINITY_DN75201_c0_g1_i1.p2 TRINITY_DN75201_c0_g1~~TRINITY_DN75201_c0_g1_i1.p2  ORF type:complete len:119 (+),score=32.32 TRINITY_DN75201_c0_g1_i1:76-432(+)
MAPTLKSDALFADIKSKFAASPALGQKLKCSFKFVLSNDAGEKKVWILNAKTATPTVNEGKETDPADCTIIMKDSDFLLMSEGKLDGMQAMMQKKMQLKGNMMLAQKLGGLFQAQAKM